MDDIIKTVTQKVHSGNEIFYENYINIKDFINIYLKDMQIATLKEEQNQFNKGRLNTLDVLIKELNRTNKELSEANVNGDKND